MTKNLTTALIAAASLLYVAVADLIPGLHRRADTRASLAQVALITVGILVVALAVKPGPSA